LRVPGFTSPRSTTPTSSFQFTSFSANGVILDFQLVGLAAAATNTLIMKQVTLTSSSQVVAQLNSTLITEFKANV
jgi:hypothetical protein